MTGIWLLPWLRGITAYIYGFPLVMMDVTREAASAPTVGKEPNWLPAPASGPFSLTDRIYWPTEAALGGTYELPPVRLLS